MEQKTVLQNFCEYSVLPNVPEDSATFVFWRKRLTKERKYTNMLLENTNIGSYLKTTDKRSKYE